MTKYKKSLVDHDAKIFIYRRAKNTETQYWYSLSLQSFINKIIEDYEGRKKHTSPYSLFQSPLSIIEERKIKDSEGKEILIKDQIKVNLEKGLTPPFLLGSDINL